MTKIKRGDSITITDRRTGKKIYGTVTEVSEFPTHMKDNIRVYTDLGFTFTIHIQRTPNAKV